MKSQSRFSVIFALRRSWAQRRVLLLSACAVILATACAWHAAARFSASAKSNTSAAMIPATPAAAMQGGCNNCCGSWSQKSSAGPSARDIHAIAYAQACNRVVMFGGRTVGGFPPANVTDQTWEWNGNTMTWTQFFPATRPAARGQHAMAYDAARNEIVLFGGFNQNFVGLNDTWVYSCATHTWTQRFPATSPSIRHGHAMAYDPNKQLVVMYGGGSGLNDTWTWDGTNWAQVVGANQPGLRTEHAMAFDGTRVILFGGSKNPGLADNDTWDLTLTSPSAGTWTMIAPNGSGPNKRQRHAMAYDPGCRKVILFGGNVDIASYSNDTWEWRRDTLTWCQTSVPTAPSPTRQFPAMAYDGKGVLINGGLNSSLAQIQDTWRFACNRAYTYRAGLMDEFALPTDPTSPTAAFAANVNAVYSTPPKMDFDETTTNKFLLHSFTGLPANIVRAELEVRANPGPGSSNDSIHLDFPPFNAPSFTWGKNFFALHPGGTWDPGQGAYTFTLDLCNLPAGGVGQPTNLLGLLNANQSLHIMIQDDTSVDYIKLRVWTCPQRLYSRGFPVDSLGQAQLSEDANGAVVIGNIGASGNDGATFQVGETNGAALQMIDTLSSLPNGSYVEARGIGRVSGAPNSPASSLRISMTNTDVKLIPNYSALGASTFHVTLYNDGNTVFSQGGLSGNAVSVPAANVAPTLQFGESGNIIIVEEVLGFASISIIIGEEIVLRVNGQDIGTGDTLVFTPENPTQSFDLLTNFQFFGSGVSTARAMIGNITVVIPATNGFSTAPHVQVGGSAQLEPFIGGLAVTGIGSSGQDGVTFNTRLSTGLVLRFDDIDPMAIAPIGSVVQVSTHLNPLILPPPPPKDDFLTIRKHTPRINFTNLFELSTDFSQLGANSMRVTAFNGNTQVGEVTNFTGKVLLSAWPSTIGRVGPNSYGYQLDFPAGTIMAFGPCPPAPCDQLPTITQLRVLPQNPIFPSVNFSSVSVLASDLPEFTISDVTMTPYCNSTITVSPGSLAVARVNQAYSQQLIANGGLGAYSFNITSGSLNAGLSLNRVTGVISGTPTSTNSATFTVTATDDNGCTGSQQYTLTPIVCPTITVNPATLTLPAGQVGSSYSLQFSQTGGAGFPSWTVSAGTLPNGLTLNVITGLLSGNPTAAGTFNFSVTATDVNGCTGMRPYSLTIGCPTVTVNPATIANGFVGTVYSQTFTATGGAAPYTFARVTGTLPPGLTLATGGTLTGTPTTAGTFTFTVQATDSGGCTGTRDYTVIISSSGLQFYPLATPMRVVDTRPNEGNCDNVSAPIAAGTSLTTLARITCGNVTIPATARAIVGNITVINQTSQAGYLTLYPDGVAPPLAANMIYGPNGILANNFTVGLSADGRFNVFGERTIHIIVDISGYFAPPATEGLYFHPLARPVRITDTRVGLGNCDSVNAPIAAGTSLTTQARITCEGLTIPSAARAIIGNVTVINGSGQTGYLTIYPNGIQPPLAANMIYFPGQILSNAFTVGLGADGRFDIFAERTIDVVVDVAGYYSTEATDINGTGLLLTPLSRPLRVADTRAAQGNCDNIGAPITGGTSLGIPSQLTCEGITIPNTARAVLGNVTVINLTSNAGFLTLYPDGVTLPLAANMIYFPGQVLANAFVVGLNPSNGQFRIYAERTLEAIVDVSGYFAP